MYFKYAFPFQLFNNNKKKFQKAFQTYPDIDIPYKLTGNEKTL